MAASACGTGTLAHVSLRLVLASAKHLQRGLPCHAASPDRADGKPRQVIPAFRAGVDDVALHPNGTHLVAVGSDRETLFRGAIKSFEISTGKMVRRMKQLHGGLARSVVISDDGKFVMSSSDEAALNILVHHFRTGQLLHALEGHTAHVRQLCVQGEYLASVSHDHTVRVWLWRSGKCAEVLSHLPTSSFVHINRTASGGARVRVGDGVCMGTGGRWIAHTTTVTLCSGSKHGKGASTNIGSARGPATPIDIPRPSGDEDASVATDSEASSPESLQGFLSESLTSSSSAEEDDHEDVDYDSDGTSPLDLRRHRLPPRNARTVTCFRRVRRARSRESLREARLWTLGVDDSGLDPLLALVVLALLPPLRRGPGLALPFALGLVHCSRGHREHPESRLKGNECLILTFCSLGFGHR
eukprot:scaffold1087_cov198-Pinguiococcus_pyrenoidosus.AAC.4